MGCQKICKLNNLATQRQLQVLTKGSVKYHINVNVFFSFFSYRLCILVLLMTTCCLCNAAVQKINEVFSTVNDEFVESTYSVKVHRLVTCLHFFTLIIKYCKQNCKQKFDFSDVLVSHIRTTVTLKLFRRYFTFTSLVNFIELIIDLFSNYV